MDSQNDTHNLQRGHRIRELIKNSGFKKFQVADAAGISGAMVSLILGGAGFNLEVLEKLANKLDTSADYILTGQDPFAGIHQLSPKARRAVLALVDNLQDD